VMKRRRSSRGVTKRNVKRRRWYRRARLVGRRRASSIVHHFRRGMTSAVITGNAVFQPYLNSKIILFNNTLNFAELTALYDQYRINYVVDKYWLRIDPSAQTAASASYPRMYICRDLDDSAVPGSLNELRERNNCKIKVMNPNKPIKIAWRPNVLDSVYRTSVADGAATPRWGQWIDVAYPDLAHFGYKFAIDDLTNTNYKVDVETVIYFSCKNQR